MKVLVVDDSKSIRLLLNEYVTTFGHNTTLVESGEQAIEALKLEMFDLVLMDIEMPGMNGYETTRQIRALFRDEWFPIIFLSTNNDDEHVQEGIDSGGDAYLTKPVSAVKLQSHINAMARISGMRHELRDTSLKMKNVIDSALDGIIIINDQGIIELVNRATLNLFGYSEEELLGKNVKILVPGSIRDHHDEYINNYRTTRTKKIIGIGREVEGLRKDGSTFPFELSISEVSSGRGVLFVGLVHDITEQKKREEDLRVAHERLRKANVELEQISLIDSLTQIANRRCFDQTLENELRRARRDNNNLTLLLCDIDYFKRFNDASGHQAGDSCLKRVAAVLKRSLHRSSDLAARYGGEEFAMILPGTDIEGGKVVAENIRAAVWNENLPHAASEVADRVTLSLGVAAFDSSTDSDVVALIEKADKALYNAKESGRNRSSF